ncbi:zinc finger protein 609-like isoform X2 [Paramacrobiotus metropolitanus]|uniref:zinc finger protein 609-like isoform X2 n=1 Tax=Paramacrobiotus metropolitanus TaxID=2943436 RepID=UPI0024463522|nr:zinc finger protein 609-like isoform X2 [Paramacrobiotus metropolitanus]
MLAAEAGFDYKLETCRNSREILHACATTKTDRHSSGSQDAGTGTCSVSTFTEPDLIGPLEPGTPVTLEGIVWHESVTKGFVVVNITWRGKTYMGTLMDYAQLEWAPPRHCDSPPSDIDSTRSPAKDKTVKRSRNGVLGLTEGDLTSQLRGGKTRRGANFQTPASPARSDASSGKRKGRVPNTTKSSTAPDNNAPSDLLPCVTDEGKAKRGRRAASGPSTPSSEQPTPSSASPPLLECPEANCSKKFPNLNALRFHQQDQHSRLVEDDRSCDSQPETRCSSESANAPSHAVPLTTESSNSSLFSKSDMDSLTAMQLQLVSATTHQPAKPDASKAVLPEITPTSNTNAMPISVPSATVATLQNPSVSSDPALKAVLEPTLAAPLSNSDNAARGEDSVETDNKADKQRNSGRRKQSRPCLSEQKGSTTKENTTVSEKNNRPSETSVLDVLRGKKPAADLLEPVKKQSKVGSSGSKPDASYDSDSSESALTEEQARNIVTAKLDPTMLDTLKSLGIRPFGVSSSISAEVNNPAVKTAVAMCQKLGNRIRDPEIPHTSAKNASLNRPLDLKITPSAAPTSPLVTTVKTQEHPERTESAYSDISDDGDDVKPDKDIEMPSVPTTPISSASDRPPYLGFFPSSPFLLQGLGEPDGKRSSPSELPKKMPFAPYVYGGLPIASPDHFANSGLTFPNILEFPPNRSEADSKARPTDPGADAGPSGSAVKTPGRSTEAKAIKEETVKGDKGEGKCKSPSVKETSKVPLEAKNEPVKPKEEMAKAVSPVANKLPPANPPLYAQPPYLPPPGFRPGMPPGGYPPPNHPLYMGPRPLFPQDQMQFLNMMYGYGMQRGGPMPPGMPPLGEPLPYDLQQRLYSPGQFTHKIHELTATKEGNNKNTPPTSASSILSENKKPVMQSQENVKKAGEAPAVKGSRPVKTGLADGRLDRVNLEQASSQSRRGAGPHPSGASASALGPDVPAAHTVDSHQAFASQKPPTLHLPSSNSN